MRSIVLLCAFLFLAACSHGQAASAPLSGASGKQGAVVPSPTVPALKVANDINPGCIGILSARDVARVKYMVALGVQKHVEQLQTLKSKTESFFLAALVKRETTPEFTEAHQAEIDRMFLSLKKDLSDRIALRERQLQSFPQTEDDIRLWSDEPAHAPASTANQHACSEAVEFARSSTVEDLRLSAHVVAAMNEVDQRYSLNLLIR